MLRLDAGDQVVAMLVACVDGLLFEGSRCSSDVAVDALSNVYPTKKLGERSWYMGSEYRRGREVGTLEISQTQFILSVIDRNYVSNEFPSQRFRHWISVP